MDKIEFRPKFTIKIWFSYIFFVILILGFLTAAFLIRETEQVIIFTGVSVLLAALMIYSLKTNLIKRILFEDQIIIERYFLKDINVQYDEIVDVGPLFIKTRKISIPLNGYQNSSELVRIFMDKIQKGSVKPKENHHAKRAREAVWASAASVIAYILYVVIALFVPIPIRTKELKFFVIFFPLFILIYLILKAIDTRKQTDAAKIIDNGVMLVRLGDYKGAMEAFDKALEIEPENAYAYGGKADVLLHEGKFEDALLLYDKAIELAPKNAAGHLNKGVCLVELNRIEEAIECYDRAHTLDKDEELYYFNKAIALEKLGRLEEALSLINKLIKKDRKIGIAFYRKSLILARLDKREDAIAALKQAIKLNPDLAEEAKADEGFENIRYETGLRNLIE